MDFSKYKICTRTQEAELQSVLRKVNDRTMKREFQTSIPELSESRNPKVLPNKTKRRGVKSIFDPL